MIRSILVVGGGSDGLLAAHTFKRKIPALDVEVIYKVPYRSPTTTPPTRSSAEILPRTPRRIAKGGSECVNYPASSPYKRCGNSSGNLKLVVHKGRENRAICYTTNRQIAALFIYNPFKKCETETL